MVRDIIIFRHFPNCCVEGNCFPFSAKENAGPVKPRIDIVEQTVKTVVGSSFEWAGTAIACNSCLYL